MFDYVSNWTSNQVGQKNDHLVKMTNGFESIGTSSQVGQSKMMSLVKVNNGGLIKLDILCYLIDQNNY
jgi:response regulator of citrate/malate metabolism